MRVFAVLLVLSIFFAGCIGQTEDGETMKKPIAEGGEMMKNGTLEGEVAAGENAAMELKSLAKNYYRYDKAAYQQALSEGNVVFLDFHANWCPICNAEKPGILAAFNELDYTDVIGFQVHYNDDQTNDDDRAIAREFGITYQHTKVLVKDGNVALKSLEQFDKERVKSEISKLVA